MVTARSVLFGNLRRFRSALRALVNDLVPGCRHSRPIVLITIARDAWHSEQRTNASKQVLDLVRLARTASAHGLLQEQGMLR